MESNLEIRALVDRTERSDPSVLSVYLDIDQGESRNLNRGFETALDALLDQTAATVQTADEKSLFEEAANLVREAVQKADTEGRSMVLIADAADGFLWTRQYLVRLPRFARWSRKPYVHPLAGISDDFYSYGVILVDRTQARILTSTLEQLQLRKEIAAVAAPDRTKTTGSDQIKSSQKQIQRSADDHVARHLHDVATTAVKSLSPHGVRRVVVIGSERTASALSAALERTKAFDVIRTVAGSVGADARQILEATSPIVEAIEREEEIALVEQLLTTSAKAGRAVAGVADTLASINKKEVYELVYADQAKFIGQECASCGALLVDRPFEACPYCQGTLRRDEEMLERVVERCLQIGAKIEVVRGRAAERLGETGGVGALLRTASARSH